VSYLLRHSDRRDPRDSSKLYELLAAGLVRSVRIDGSRRVPVEALEDYVACLLD
jgi:hypothetical protein